MKNYIIAIDEGTTSSRAVLYNIKQQKIVKIVATNIKQIYPKAGYVEENAGEIYAESMSVLTEILEAVPSVKEICGIGITNQRETVIMWNKKTGRPIYNALIWQCRRTADYCESIKAKRAKMIAEKTGLIIDAYFSATKIKWLLENVKEAEELLKEDNLCVGTVDSYLIYKMTGGKSFVTDATNASRTMLYNIHTGSYDDELLELFGVPKKILPNVVSSDEIVGEFTYENEKIPICGIAGDQQAALFGQCCFNRGSGKITYGTGMFMLFNTGETFVKSNHMLTTIAYKLKQKTTYALEGSVFNAGSAVQWLRDGLGLFDASEKTEPLAKSVKDTLGVYVVPAFTGLGAPYWNSEAKGIITGITRGVTKAHITRAVLEAMAYSSKDLADIMVKESGENLKEIKCDGGASANNFLMQFNADLLNAPINRPIERESTALGAIFLCGLGLGVFKFSELESLRKTDKIFIPDNSFRDYETLYKGWQKAIERCML